MSATTVDATRHEPSATLAERGRAHAWFRRLTSGTRFGDLALVAFLLCQVLDGALTYVGVVTFGRSIEANPLLAWLMDTVGEGTAVTGAKILAGTCGIALHLTAVHRIVAVLTLVYLGVAVIPWTGLLFF